MIPTFQSIDELQCWVFDRILTEGIDASPRDVPTLELPPVLLTLANPRRRVVTAPSRRWSLPLAIGEFCWHLSASDKLAFIQYYSNRWREFADDELRIRGSCYGHRLFGHGENGDSQWEQALNLLRHDPATRRAVLLTAQPLNKGDASSKDVACASSLQFLLRNRRLDAILHMRSNDAFWGLPYDVFLFTMLQELFAAELRVELGVYYHSVGSIHLYKRHLHAARSVLKDNGCREFEMPRLLNTEEIPQFLAVEHSLRLMEPDAEQRIQGLSSYWRQLAEVLASYGIVKHGHEIRESSGRVLAKSPYRDFIFLENGRSFAQRA
jgi:thymidylate synthase